MKKAGLYLHFPFCRRACFYCHFFKRRHRPAAVGDYLARLQGEMSLRRDPALEVDTVYFGGGSPSLLDAGQVSRLLDAAAKHFHLAARAEITLEANPEDLSAAKLRQLRSSGINRLSVGAQSFQERDLRFLKRTHGGAQAIRSIALAREAGFANLGLDLMIGLPTQTAASMEMNFRALAALAPAHVSVYILENVANASPPEREARLYFQARRSLLGLGYQHYEVSNFSRPGRASRHNLKYWRMGSYVGLGPSAAGFLDGRDYHNISRLKKYGEALQEGKLPQVKIRQPDPAKRRIVTGLRLLAGIPAPAFASFPRETAFLLREGFLARRGKNVAVPAEKILLLNEILGYFI